MDAAGSPDGRASAGGCAFAALGLAALGVLQLLAIVLYVVVESQGEAIWFVFPTAWTLLWGSIGIGLWRRATRGART